MQKLNKNFYKNLTYKHHAGDAHLFDMNVVVYENDKNVIVLIAENVKKSKVIADPRYVSKDQYAKLREMWEEDCCSADDARITQRALDFCGIEVY